MWLGGSLLLVFFFTRAVSPLSMNRDAGFHGSNFGGAQGRKYFRYLRPPPRAGHGLKLATARRMAGFH